MGTHEISQKPKDRYRVGIMPPSGDKTPERQTDTFDEVRNLMR